MSWQLVYTSQARRDAKKLLRAGLKPQAERLLKILTIHPCQMPPPDEKLVGDLAGVCSRRIHIQHRLVYQVFNEIQSVKVIRMWTHYEYMANKRFRLRPTSDRRQWLSLATSAILLSVDCSLNSDDRSKKTWR